MPGNVSQLSNQCVDLPLGNYNNTQICLSSWFESNLSNRSQYVVYNNNSSIFFFYNKWCTTRFYPRYSIVRNLEDAIHIMHDY